MADNGNSGLDGLDGLDLNIDLNDLDLSDFNFSEEELAALGDSDFPELFDPYGALDDVDTSSEKSSDEPKYEPKDEPKYEPKDEPKDELEDEFNPFGVSEEQDDEDEPAAPSIPAASIATSRDAPVDEASLDAQIAEALQKDFMSDARIEIEDSLGDFVKDVSVYVDKDEEVTKTEKKKSRITVLIDSIPQKFLMALAGTQVVIIGIFAVLILIWVFKVKDQDAALAQRGIAIAQREASLNNANFIFINETVGFEEGELTLIKMKMDAIATVFYFNGYIDIDKYDVTLHDSKNKMYNLNMSYLESAPMVQAEQPATEFHFQPLPQDTESFTLTIKQLQTNVSTPIKFTLKNAMAFQRPRRINTPLTVDVDTDLVSVTINNGVFSSTGSTLNYMIKWKSDAEVIQFGKQVDTEFFNLGEGGRKITQTKQTPNQYLFADDNTILGRMDFSPVRSLDSIVTLNFAKLYKRFQLNMEVPLSEILYTKTNSEKVIPIGDYNLVLERAGTQGDKYILVAHGEDRGVEYASNTMGSLDNRVMMVLDVQLVGRKANGMEVVIDPYVNTSELEGSDIVFDVSVERGFLTGVPAENIFFRINGLLVKLPDVNIEVDLAQAESKMPMMIESALGSVASAFEKRLGYKSGRYSFEEIDRFTKNILNDVPLMSQYEPQELTGTPIYSAQVVSWAMDGDSRLIAIVEEAWRGTENGADKRFLRTHKIVSEYGDELGWVIIYDEIIK